MDKDGRFTYSEIVTLKTVETNPFKIITNPVKNKLAVNIARTNTTNSTLMLFDLFGRKHYSWKVKQGYQEFNTYY